MSAALKINASKRWAFSRSALDVHRILQVGFFWAGKREYIKGERGSDVANVGRDQALRDGKEAVLSITARRKITAPVSRTTHFPRFCGQTQRGWTE